MTPEELKQIVVQVFADSNNGDLERAISHTAPNCTLNGEAYGIEGDRVKTAMLLQAFPDGIWTVEDLVAGDDKVAVRWSFKGTQLGDLPVFGLPATGNAVSFAGITIYRVANGLITEIWDAYDKVPLLQQLGLMPTQA